MSETLEQIALRVADSVKYNTTTPFTCDQIEEFARRLVAALGAQEPIGYYYEHRHGDAEPEFLPHKCRDSWSTNWVETILYSAPQLPCEGWQLVPVDPTREMLDAMSAYQFHAPIHRYKAMLAAAPKPEDGK